MLKILSLALLVVLILSGCNKPDPARMILEDTPPIYAIVILKPENNSGVSGIVRMI